LAAGRATGQAALVTDRRRCAPPVFDHRAPLCDASNNRLRIGYTIAKVMDNLIGLIMFDQIS
jgi:hypothetical protein